MVRVVKRSRPRIVIPICVGSNPIMHPNPIDIYTMKHYCAMPFNHVNVDTNGDYQICCRHKVPKEHRKNINQTKIEQWLQSSYLADVQQAFSDDQQHPGCQHCWQLEHRGAQSMRETQAQEYKIIGAQPLKTKVLNVETAVGNLCNFSCVMCEESNSSLLLAENLKLGIAVRDQREFAWSDDAFENLQQILDLSPRVINFRGGETLYNKNILKLITEFPANKLNTTLLHLTTNASIWTPAWAEALSKFKSVRIMFSVDAVGKLFEYMRYPGQFNQIEQNITQIVKCKNIKPVIHVTVQNLNIMHLGELIKWAKQMNIHLMLDTLVKPKWFAMTNLPPVLKQQAIYHLNDVLMQDLDEHIYSEITAYKTAMETATFDPQRWQQFVDDVSRRDAVRGNSHKDFLQY